MSIEKPTSKQSSSPKELPKVLGYRNEFAVVPDTVDAIAEEFESKGKIQTTGIAWIFKLEGGKCRVSGSIEKGVYFYLYSMECEPKRKGMGEATLRYIKQRIPKLKIYPYQVKDEAAMFWENMMDKGLITGYDFGYPY
jgi:hypothetical protein